MLCKYSKSEDITAKVKITYTFASPLWLLYSKLLCSNTDILHTCCASMQKCSVRPCTQL